MRWLILLAVFSSLMLRADSLRENLLEAHATLLEAEYGTHSLLIALANGDSLTFQLTPSEVMSPELAAQFPEIRTWSGQAEGFPELHVRCDQSPAGIFAQIFSPTEGTIYLDQLVEAPEARGSISLSEPKGRPSIDDFQCLTSGRVEPVAGKKPVSQDGAFHEVRTFRLAVIATGEYTEFHGGNISSALAAIVTVFNRVNGIYERELGVRLVLVPATSQLIYTNRNTDPFTSNAPTVTTAAEAQTTFDQVAGSANYDVGMLLNTGTYGLAYLASVCDPARKGSACMGMPEPVGEIFTTYVAHEMAHQFGANHSFNTPLSVCGANRYGPAAVEPGTGSTLMSYAGLPCGNDSLQPLMSDYFHAESLREIRHFLQSTACGSVTTFSNHIPSITVEPEFIVPKETPFRLTASGSDVDGEDLYFSWEQMDVGPATSLADPDNGLSPLFRSWPPSSNSARVFPRWDNLLQNLPSPGEKLPSTNRLIHFRVTVRDSFGKGAKAFADTHVQVVGSAGPFRITSHNEHGYFRGQQLITWDVAGTTNPPINASLVNILLSTNGGQSFDISLATHSPNDGSELVTFPELSCDNARLKIEPVGHVFFDINDSEIVVCNQPRFSSATVSGANLVLRWLFRIGKQYELEQSTSLPVGGWNIVNVPINTIGNEKEVVVPFDSTGRRFYRLREF